MKKVVGALALLLEEEKKHSIKKWINNIEQKEKKKIVFRQSQIMKESMNESRIHKRK